jgi:5'-nucleotidase
VIAAINDTHGALLAVPAPKWLQAETDDEVGGGDWFAGWMQTVRADARASGGELLILDGGDEFQGTLISNQFRGRSVTDVYNAAGVTASAVGNHEFDFGIPALRERIAQARYPILAANVFVKGTRTRPAWIRPSVLLDVLGVKVGIVGLSTVETATTTNPANVEGLDFVPGGPVAAAEADSLRAQGATVVLIAAHAGQQPGGEIDRIAEACRGKVDAIVSGHNHRALGPPPLIVAGIPIVQSGAKLLGFSLVELSLDDAGKVRTATVNAGLSPKDGGPQALFHSLGHVGARAAPAFRGRAVAPDPAVSAILRGYDGEVRALREQRIGETTVDLRKGGSDDLLGNLTADALRSGAGGGLTAEFAFQNSGGLRITEIPAGPITFGQIFDLTPFDNQQMVLSLSGEEVRDALEGVLRAGKGPMRVSGLRYVVDWRPAAGKDARQLPAGALVTRVTSDAGAVVCETKGCSETACESVCSPNRFAVAVADFLANGGDGLSVLKGKPARAGNVLTREMVVAYVKEHQPLTAEVLGSLAAGKPPRWTQIGSARRPQTGE